MRAGVQRVQDLLGIFEARAHDLAGNGVIVVVAAGAGDDGIGVNGVVFHAVDVGGDEVTASDARQDGLFGAVNGGTEQRQVEPVRAHRRDGFQSGVVHRNFETQRGVGEIGEDVVIVAEHIGGGRAKDLHEQERRTLGEDGSKLRLAHAALFFQDGRVGGDAFEDAQRLVAGNGGRIGAVEVHDEAPVRGGGGIIQSRVFSPPVTLTSVAKSVC